MLEVEERLVGTIAEVAAQAEALERAGLLAARARENVCSEAFHAKDLERIAAVKAPALDLEPLNVNSVRNELRPLDCHLERLLMDSHAGFRLTDDDRFVEFGFCCDVRGNIAGSQRRERGRSGTADPHGPIRPGGRRRARLRRRHVSQTV
jgi:hypothetical protein